MLVCLLVFGCKSTQPLRSLFAPMWVCISNYKKLPDICISKCKKSHIFCILEHLCLFIIVKLIYNILMHSVLSNKTCVRLLNGSSSISKSSLSGVIPRMLSGYRFTSPSSHTASLQSSSTPSSLAGLWLRYCAYSEAPCWSKTTCRNSSNEDLLMELMTVNLKLNFNC